MAVVEAGRGQCQKRAQVCRFSFGLVKIEILDLFGRFEMGHMTGRGHGVNLCADVVFSTVLTPIPC